MIEYYTDKLYIYPVKSLARVRVTKLNLTDRGLKFDRFWMLSDTQNQMISQRECPSLNLLEVIENETGFIIKNPSKPENTLFLLKDKPFGEPREVTIWKHTVNCSTEQNEASTWFSNYLNKEVFLLGNSNRIKKAEINGKSFSIPLNFQDGYPIHLINLKSVEDLSIKCQEFIDPARFRANVYLDLPEPYFEDQLKTIRINQIDFELIKPCERCIMVNLKNKSIEFEKQPLLALSKYRKHQNKINFGIYLQAISTIK